MMCWSRHERALDKSEVATPTRLEKESECTRLRICGMRFPNDIEQANWKLAHVAPP